ncbi:MAG: RNA 2',3'-cyclic phosphodiesterase [Nanoarchaeota archaeon]
MRLFIAIELPDDIKEYLSRIQEKIAGKEDKISLVKKEQMHLTLKFLGELQPHNAENLRNILKEVAFEPFSVNLDVIGVFPSENYIRVVWVGLKPEDKIMELQKNIDKKLEGMFKKEKGFKAHLTLARVKHIEDKVTFISKLKNIKIDNKKISISNFKLIKSTLTPEGPIYEAIESFG